MNAIFIIIAALVLAGGGYYLSVKAPAAPGTVSVDTRVEANVEHEGSVETSGTASGSGSVSGNASVTTKTQGTSGSASGSASGSVKPDAVLVVSESIQGKWQSTSDTKFIREFKADGTFVDWRDNETVDDGTWRAFTNTTADIEVSFPLQANTVYVQLVTEHDYVDTMNFKIGKLTPETLELVYMDRGGVMTFTSVQ